jgi:hypothetical protein
MNFEHVITPNPLLGCGLELRRGISDLLCFIDIFLGAMHCDELKFS